MNIIEMLKSSKKAGPHNIEVAKLCVKNPKYLEEIRENLQSNDKKLQADCAEVFAEVAKLKPELTVKYVDALLSMLDTKNNRALWESLAGLSLIASLKADKIYPHKDKLLHLAKTGSVIVIDGAVSTLGKVAARSDAYSSEIFPKLLDIMKNCIPRDIPRMAEYIAPAARENKKFRSQIKTVLERRLPECKNKTAENRVKKLIKSLE